MSLKVNYKNSIVNFTAALMKNYGVKSEYEPSALVEYLLSKKYRHVVLIVLDGLGTKVIEDNLSNGSILKTHQIMALHSVYPPTTVAATTAFITGKAPIESGWLGWHLYLEENGPSIVLFKNKVNATGEDFTKYLVKDKIGCDEWFKSLRATTSYKIFPSWYESGVNTFSDGIDKVIEITSKDEKNFTYFYFDNPDMLMHEYGTTSQIVKVNLLDMEQQINRLADNLPNDTIVLITADHGMIDVEPIELNKYPEFIDCLTKPFSGEGRCANFYVKADQKENFINLFNQLFKDHFMLYSKDEFIESHLAGLYQPHPIVDVALGDFIAVATSNYYFVEKISEGDLVFKAHHAGLTKDEIEIPVILLKRKDEVINEE